MRTATNDVVLRQRLQSLLTGIVDALGGGITNIGNQTINWTQIVGFPSEPGQAGIDAYNKEEVNTLITNLRDLIAQSDVTDVTITSDTFTLVRKSGNISVDIPTWNQDTTGNAGSATKLKNKRRIFGQEFDGTQDVEGALEATDGNFSGTVTAKELEAKGDSHVGGNLNVEGAARVGGALRVEGTAHTHDIENSNKVTTKDLEVWGSARFYEIVIDKARKTNGISFQSCASAKLDIVEQDGNTYRCYFLAKDSDGRQITNDFLPNDQILMMTFNVGVGTSYNVGNRYYWALCSAISATPVVKDGREYHWIDIDMSVKASNSNAVPQEEDEVVVLGHRSAEHPERQNTIVFASIDNSFLGLRRPDADKDGNHPLIKAPYIVQLQGINSFEISYSNPNNYGNIISNGYNRLAGYLYSSSSSQDDAVVKVEVSHVDYYLCTPTLEAPEASASGWAEAASPTAALPYIWKKTIKTYNDGTSQSFVEFVNKFQKGTDGEKGKDGTGITFEGERWTQDLVDAKGGKLPKLYAVRMGDKFYVVINPEGTANPPVWCVTDWQGRRLRTSDGGYVLRRGDDGNVVENLEEWEPLAKFGIDGKDGYTPIKGVDYFDGAQGIGVKYISVYKRGNVSQMDKPNDASVSFDNPIPSGWSKGIPAGGEICWQSTRAFFTDGRADEWSKPEPITDTADFDRCFSKDDKQPPKPTTHGVQFDEHWHNDPQEGDKWMATDVKHNGVWDNKWQITQILGENATNVNIRGEWKEGMTLNYMDVVRFEGISYLYKSKETWSGYPRAKIIDYQGRIVRNWTGGLLWANNGLKSLFATDDRWQVFTEDAVSLVVAKGFEVAKIKGKATDGVFTFASEQEALVELRRGNASVDDDMTYSIELNGCKGVTMQRVGSVCRINIPVTATVDSTKVSGYDYYLPISDCSITVNCSYGGRIYSVVLPIQIDYSDRWSEFVQTDEQFKSELNAVKKKGEDLTIAQSLLEQKLFGNGDDIEGVVNELLAKIKSGDEAAEADLIQLVGIVNGHSSSITNIKNEIDTPNTGIKARLSLNAEDIKDEAETRQIAVAGLKSEIKLKDQEISTIRSNITSLTEDTKDLSRAKASMQAEIDNNKAEISASVKYDKKTGKLESNVLLTGDKIEIDTDNLKVRGNKAEFSGKVIAEQYRAKMIESHLGDDDVIPITTSSFIFNEYDVYRTFVLPEITSVGDYIEITCFNFTFYDTPKVRCCLKDRFIVRSGSSYIITYGGSEIKINGTGVYKFFGIKDAEGHGRWAVTYVPMVKDNEIEVLSDDDQPPFPIQNTPGEDPGTTENEFGKVENNIITVNNASAGTVIKYVTENGTPISDFNDINTF